MGLGHVRAAVLALLELHRLQAQHEVLFFAQGELLLTSLGTPSKAIVS